MRGDLALSLLKHIKNPMLIAAIFFVLGGIITPFLEQIVKSSYQKYSEGRNAPQAVICAPLQESRLIVRLGADIIHDVEYGFPNETLTAFQAGTRMLENVEILLYPLSHHGKRPVIYYANVQTSDRMATNDSTVEITDSSVFMKMPFLKAQEIVYFDLLFGQPVSILMEVRADSFSARFTGVAGCADAPRSISSPPLVSIFEYFFSECGENGDELCGILATPEGGLAFEVVEGVQPTFEEVIIWQNKRISRTPEK